MFKSFRRRYDEIEVMVIRPRDSGVRQLFIVLFWLWGAGGLVLCLGEFFTAISARPTGIGVGTSAFVTMEVTLWLGGTVFFGLAALLAQSTMGVAKYQPRE